MFFYSSLPHALADDRKTKILILYASNMPIVNGGSETPSLAKIATFVDNERTKNPNLLFLHGGDSLAPSILSSLDRGAHIIDLMNSLNPDLMAISKREFSFGEDVLILRSQEAVFPFLSNNTRDIATGEPYPFFEESIILETNGIKVGIVASTSEAAATRYSAEKTLFLDVIETTKISAIKLREQGAQVIISMYDDKKDNLESLIADGYVDIIFETSFYQNGVVHPGIEGFIHHDLKTGYVSRIEFTFDPEAEKKVEIINFELVNIDSLDEKPDTKELIDSYIEPLNHLLDMEIGHFNTSFTYSRQEVRGGENAFANFIVDVMRDHTQADIALLNGGAIRGANEFTSGMSVKRRHIQSALPYRNTITTIEVSGQDILDAIEHGIECMNISSGCGVHASNMRVNYDNNKPVGQRIIEVTINKQPIEADKTYSMGTTNYIANGGDGFTMFKDKTDINDTMNNVLLWEIVSNYISQNKFISPKIDGRLTRVKNNK